MISQHLNRHVLTQFLIDEIDSGIFHGLFIRRLPLFRHVIKVNRRSIFHRFFRVLFVESRTHLSKFICCGLSGT